MYLKDDGETIVMHTMLTDATFRKHVIKISDLCRVDDKDAQLNFV